jgi:molybdenum-dependent oxidoreductase-like protein
VFVTHHPVAIERLITTIGVKSIITQPNDDTETMSPGVHMIRGYAWSGAGAIDQVDVSLDGGETWHSAHIEQPRDRFMWVRWSSRWDVRQKVGSFSCYFTFKLLK